MSHLPNNKIEVRKEWKPVVSVHEQRGDVNPWLPACAFEGHSKLEFCDLNLLGATRPEEWRPILRVRSLEVNGMYEVSSHGRVRSTVRVLDAKPRNGKLRKSRVQQPEPRRHQSRILTLKNDDDKIRVTLHSGRKAYAVTVSRLVHEAFIGPILEGAEVDHINRRPQQNHVSNLRVCTHSQNLSNKGPLTKESGYIGVHRLKGKWGTIVTFNKKKVGHKVSRNSVHCAIYHDMIAKKHFGEFANLNFPDGLPAGYTERDALRPELPAGSKLPLIGVARAKRRFRAHVVKDGVKVLDQNYDTVLEAVRARDLAVLPSAGGKVKLNISVGEHIGLYDTEEELLKAVELASR